MDICNFASSSSSRIMGVRKRSSNLSTTKRYYHKLRFYFSFFLVCDDYVIILFLKGRVTLWTCEVSLWWAYQMSLPWRSSEDTIFNFHHQITLLVGGGICYLILFMMQIASHNVQSVRLLLYCVISNVLKEAFHSTFTKDVIRSHFLVARYLTIV